MMRPWTLGMIAPPTIAMTSPAAPNFMRPPPSRATP